MTVNPILITRRLSKYFIPHSLIDNAANFAEPIDLKI
jgi:hypothetical protein